MKLCEHNHEPVAYTTRACPVCALRVENLILLDEIRELKDELTNLIREVGHGKNN